MFLSALIRIHQSYFTIILIFCNTSCRRLRAGHTASFIRLSFKVPSSVKPILGFGISFSNFSKIIEESSKLIAHIKNAVRVSKDHYSLCAGVVISPSSNVDRAQEEDLKFLITDAFTEVSKCQGFETISVPMFTASQYASDDGRTAQTSWFQYAGQRACCALQVALHFHDLTFVHA
jgi:hypothetical protein